MSKQTEMIDFIKFNLQTTTEIAIRVYEDFKATYPDDSKNEELFSFLQSAFNAIYIVHRDREFIYKDKELVAVNFK